MAFDYLTNIKFLIVVQIVLQLIAAGHALVTKRDPRAAAGWVAVILLSPVAGALGYWLFGINRLKRRAMKKFAGARLHETYSGEDVAHFADESAFLGLEALSKRVTGHPLIGGNDVVILSNGEEAYPAMLNAIDCAKSSIGLCTYIFDRDESGKIFAKALIGAAERGVDVRIIVDALGLRYSFPSILTMFQGSKVKFVRYLPTRMPWHFHYSQLRNHRKIMIIDGNIGFTGGMNIRHDHMVTKAKFPTLDTHFQIKGPLVQELTRIFLVDWGFAARQSVTHDWNYPAQKCGDVECRIVSDGPDESLDQLRWVILGALSLAKKNVKIITPYFLPDRGLIEALALASLRGVNIEILLPEKNNLKMVQWASLSMLWQLLERGCNIYLAPGNFDHSKLMVVDDYWSFIGSANWDARSFRLNFELNVECYDRAFSGKLVDIFEKKKSGAKKVSLSDVDARPLWQRLRDGACRLFMPYL